MSTPLATIFHGDVTLEQGSDVTQFGWGDLTVSRRCVIQGTETSTGPTSGSLVVYGGMAVSKTTNLMENLNVLYGITRLTETHIDTTNGLFTCTGGNSASISVGGSSQFVSTGGNLLLSSSTQSVQLYGGLNSTKAVDIQAVDVAGGVQILSGTQSGISLIAGTGGINGFCSNGNLSLTAVNGNASFLVSTQSANQNMVLSLAGNTDSQIKIDSSGSNVTNTALVLTTSNTLGSIVISNANGLGSGSLTQLVGSGGFSVLTNTSGSISLTSQGAGSQLLVKSSSQNQNLVLSLQGPTDSGIIIRSEGIASAIQIQTLNTAGNISVTQPPRSQGSVQFLTGAGGFSATTQTGGSINMSCYGAQSYYSNVTIADGQDLNVSVSGNTNSRVRISCDGKGSDSVRIESTNVSNGGISIVAAGGPVSVASSNQSLGVQIATGNPGIPVQIGTPTSTTTIFGNLDVRGVTTAIESTVVTIDDNIIVVNNAPSGTSDGGMAIKRYQYANDNGMGDVVLDTPDESGTVQNGGNSATTVQLDIGASNVNDTYNGWWIKITSGQGANQVRKIKSYDGSTRIATIYSTSDQTTSGAVPVEGMNFSTVPNNTSTYQLFPCHYVMSIWDESHDEFAFICNPSNPTQVVTPAHYSNLHINNMVANAITATSINGSAADITTYVTLNNSNTLPQTITGFQNTWGIFTVYVQPVNDTTKAQAIFMIGRVNVNSTPGTVVRIISVKGAQYDQLDIQWPAGSNPQLMFRPNPIGGMGSTQFKVKIVSL